MKTFHYPLGHVAVKVLTVGELIEKLANFPRDMPVLAAWEGQSMPLGFSMWTEQFGTGVEAERCECLMVDAEYGDTKSGDA